MFHALATFGAPLTAHGVRTADFATPGTVYQLGLPPRRIDVLTSISHRVSAAVKGVPLNQGTGNTDPGVSD